MALMIDKTVELSQIAKLNKWEGWPGGGSWAA